MISRFYETGHIVKDYIHVLKTGFRVMSEERYTPVGVYVYLNEKELVMDIMNVSSKVCSYLSL